MANPLTSGERVLIRNYLGWSERFHQTDSALEMGMNALDVDTDGLNNVRDEMDKIAVIETKIQGITDLFKVKQLGTIKIEGAEVLSLFRNLGRSSIARIAITLGVEIRADYFGTTGPLGEATRHGVFPTQGGNFVPRG
jgi:hypothetical protein